LRDTLARAAARALASGDVPVGAVLLLNDSVIGTGWNTVQATGDAAGHAEINALSDALRRSGRARFHALPRTSLTRYTTYEPCDLCAAALREYRIGRVEYGFPKTQRHWWKNWFRHWKQEAGTRQTDEAALQDSLFRLHPAYPGHYTD
jgi:tRNA(Arg) A34 adenosine deaminase TadA